MFQRILILFCDSEHVLQPGDPNLGEVGQTGLTVYVLGYWFSLKRPAVSPNQDEGWGSFQIPTQHGKCLAELLRHCLGHLHLYHELPAKAHLGDRQVLV